MQLKSPVFCLMGPTASGKTALACALVEHANMEIISVDSAMIYREMNIGTAKPDAELLQHAPHHLIDIIDPIDSYSAADFCVDAELLCDKIIQKGKIPLLVGGTMMYFNALQKGLAVLPTADLELRKELLQDAKTHGWQVLHARLEKVDAQAAARIHPNDTQRIQRALEVYYLTGQSLTELLAQQSSHAKYQYINIALLPESRAWLHDLIALRFKDMLNAGLIVEVENLIQKWQLTTEHPALRCVGYRQVFEYLQGNYDVNILYEKGVAATRQLAKRQLTWLRSWSCQHTFTAERLPTISEVLNLLAIN
jgi:tRNA dimethylallyltransferase